MPQLLISVRNSQEAAVALETGQVNILDVKEPNRGGLGAAEPQVLSKVAETCQLFRDQGAMVQLSVAMGELNDDESLEKTLQSEAIQFFDYAKVGLAECINAENWENRWVSWKSRLPAKTSAVAVAYADWYTARSPHPRELIAFAQSMKAPGVLLDTQGKTHTLFDVMTLSEIMESRKLIREQLPG